MLCHLIRDMHEWMNEIPTVPTYYPAKPQPRKEVWQNQWGNELPLSFTLVWHSEKTQEVYKWEAPPTPHHIPMKGWYGAAL